MGKADIGIYGLGTMGSALALNFAEKGFGVAVANRETEWIDGFLAEAAAESPAIAERLFAARDLKAFVAGLARPRVVLMMIPSGAPVDEMIAAFRPLLQDGDTLIDAGNADFNDTVRRARALGGTGLHFVGMGVSGGAEGARHGPSMMFGGSAHSWQALRPMAEAVAARFDGAPCVAHLGPDGTGHFVKTVHNGIEYADMQMIAETYGLLRDANGLSAQAIGAHFAAWNDGPLASYLTEITAHVLAARDADGSTTVDGIVDSAGQKGTGRWTVIEALKMGQSASTIEAAVAARAWSSARAARAAAADLLADAGAVAIRCEPQTLERALLAGRILSHAQGFDVIAAGALRFGWDIDRARIAEIWRAGCIIRSALLDDLAAALRGPMPEGQLILAPEMRARLAETVPALRAVVVDAARAGLPVPALSGALSWYDTMRQARGTANLIQAQRDFFGAHGFERIGAAGPHHGDWPR